MNLSISLNLTLNAADANRTSELGTHLTQFFNNCLSEGTLNLLHTGDIFRFVDLNLYLSRRAWNLLSNPIFLEIDLVQTR